MDEVGISVVQDKKKLNLSEMFTDGCGVVDPREEEKAEPISWSQMMRENKREINEQTGHEEDEFDDPFEKEIRK